MTSTSFSDFELPPELIRALDKLGLCEPTAVQAQAIPPAMAGRDLLISAATGSGKTAAFLLPMLQRFFDDPPRSRDAGTRGLVLVPTRELAQQVFQQSMKLGSYTRLTAGVITGGVPTSHQISILRKNPHVLIATPGRLLEHLGTGEADLTDVEVVVLDEADRMLDMGFAEDVLAILGHCSLDRQSMLLSATLDHRGLQPLTEQFLHDPETITTGAARTAPSTIRQQVVLADDISHKQALTVWLLQHEKFEKAMVFTSTREGAATLGSLLRAKGLRTGVLHGELEQRERNRVIGMLRNGQINVLVATDLAARGLDVPGTQLVINFDVARNGDDHLHRTGRTGRAGEEGLAISLVGHNEWNRISGIERYLRLSFQHRVIKGLQARFRGPKKQKKPKVTAETKAVKDERQRVKVRSRERKNIGKRRIPSGGPVPDSGNLPPPKKRRD